jgi:hypothetical protein
MTGYEAEYDSPQPVMRKRADIAELLWQPTIPGTTLGDNRRAFPRRTRLLAYLVNSPIFFALLLTGVRFRRLTNASQQRSNHTARLTRS